MSPETDHSTGPYRANRLCPQHSCLAERGLRSHISPEIGIARSQKLLRYGAQVTARASPRPPPPGLPEGRTATSQSSSGDTGRRKQRGSGRGWFPDRPCPLRDRPILTGGGTSTYGGRISWRAINSLTRRWNAKCFTGAGGGNRPQSLMRLSKYRSRKVSTAVGDFTTSAAFRLTRAVVTGLVPGSYRSTSSIPQVPRVTRGLTEGTKRLGCCQRYTDPGVQNQGGSLGRTVGFPCHY